MERLCIFFSWTRRGTHGGSHAFVLGGIAIHERGARRLHRQLDSAVMKYTAGTGRAAGEYELHVSEMRNAKKPKSSAASHQKASVWVDVERMERLQLLRDCYAILRDFVPENHSLPMALFGVAVDRNFRPSYSPAQREQFAYEVLLNKFDVMLKRNKRDGDHADLGLVIHDRRLVAERDIQDWTREWRRAAGTIGRLRNLADVPLFADSKATRLIQVADLVSYAIWSHYFPEGSKEDCTANLWEGFDTKDGNRHGMVHYTPSYGSGSCTCESCRPRLMAEAAGLRP
ncbi:DUF3800 domain-containing protein [Streptomyces sp. DSM 44917]|uniref:DUF3800 domain-containing protein n=1 Tax=Streptomyces boetiae TaxID=3075541 RepID=A0ABU2L271_9ACTN|nr:DUF3800 domain-containing protein [Streptomyces sp. DSM 44917]MDT0305516.1 DUF3800 domain-containing protein [Streptomyces sp. DSM 44917]